MAKKGLSFFQRRGTTKDVQLILFTLVLLMVLVGVVPSVWGWIKALWTSLLIVTA